MGILGAQISSENYTEVQEDPTAFFQKLGVRELNLLQEHVRLWHRSISELLEKLGKTMPTDTMLSEIHYWRDMARILEACCAEVKLPFVEFTL